jgi:hypothetical protein
VLGVGHATVARDVAVSDETDDIVEGSSEASEDDERVSDETHTMLDDDELAAIDEELRITYGDDVEHCRRFDSTMRTQAAEQKRSLRRVGSACERPIQIRQYTQKSNVFDFGRGVD